MAQQVWYLFRSFDFLYVTNALNKQVDEEGDASVCEIRAYEMCGPMPRLHPVTRRIVNREALCNRPSIYMYDRGTREVIRLLPFVRYGALSSSDSRLVSAYYVGKIEGVFKKNWKVSWKSYDCGDARDEEVRGSKTLESDHFAPENLRDDGQELCMIYKNAWQMMYDEFYAKKTIRSDAEKA